MWRGAVRRLSAPHRYPLYGTFNKGHSRNMFVLGAFITAGTGLLAYRTFQKSEEKRLKMQADFKPLDPYQATAPSGDYEVDEDKLKKVILEGDTFLRQEIIKDINRNVEDYALRNVSGVSTDKFKQFVKQNVNEIHSNPTATTETHTEKQENIDTHTPPVSEITENPSETTPQPEAPSSIPEPSPELKEEFQDSTPKPAPQPSYEDVGTLTQAFSEVPVAYPEYSAKLEEIRVEIREQQVKQEEELLKKVNESIQSMVDQLIPKLASQLRTIEPPTTASALSEQIDFSQASSEEIRKKFEDVIRAYEAKLEGVGIKNYDYFLQKLNEQKESFRTRLEEVRAQYKEEIQRALIPRDDAWQETIAAELDRAEEHQHQQNLLDLEHVKQETELKLTQYHQEEIAKITDTLQQAATQRLSEMDNMIMRIKQIEELQEKQFNAILALFAVHKLHVTVENMQKTLNSDEGSFTHDLQSLKEIATHDRVVATVLSVLNDHYSYLLENGVPTQAQLLREFKESSQKARKSALMSDDSLTSWVTATLAYKFIPQNTQNVDEFDSFSVLSSAESALHKGDYKGALKVLKRLSGLPKEEMSDFLKDLSSRVAIMHMLEVLSTLSIAVVNDLINIKFKY
jgi:hypothetical protein